MIKGDSHYKKNVFSQPHLIKGELTEPLPLVSWMYYKYIEKMSDLLSWL